MVFTILSEKSFMAVSEVVTSINIGIEFLHTYAAINVTQTFQLVFPLS
jgi:hypothetical protein